MLLLPPYWNFTFGFDFDLCVAISMSFCMGLTTFIPIERSAAELWRHIILKIPADFYISAFRHAITYSRPLLGSFWAYFPLTEVIHGPIRHLLDVVFGRKA